MYSVILLFADRDSVSLPVTTKDRAEQVQGRLQDLSERTESGDYRLGDIPVPLQVFEGPEEHVCLSPDLKGEVCSFHIAESDLPRVMPAVSIRLKLDGNSIGLWIPCESAESGHEAIQRWFAASDFGEDGRVYWREAPEDVLRYMVPNNPEQLIGRAWSAHVGVLTDSTTPISTDVLQALTER